MKYCFVFICQKGHLEIESVLLAASLKRNLKCEYELIAAIPTFDDKLEKPEEFTINILHDLGVRTVYFTNNLLAKYPIKVAYLMTNKFYCLTITNDANKLIFLDSDIL